MSRGGRRSTTFDSTRARAVAIAREAAKRARRAEAATLEANVASSCRGPDSEGRASDPAAGACAGVADPIVLPALVEGPDGSLTMPEPLKLQGGSRIDDRPEPASGPRPTPRSPSLARSPARVVADLALPRTARRPAPRDLVQLEPVEQAPAPALVKLDPAPDPAAEAQRIARARVSMARLYQAIANPHLAQHSIPWAPDVVATAGVCTGCSQAITADRVAGHAVTRANAKRGRCVRWCFRIPEEPTS